MVFVKGETMHRAVPHLVWWYVGLLALWSHGQSAPGGTGGTPKSDTVSGFVDAEYRPLVPHRLLALMHAPQVHEELQWTDEQILRLEAFFAKLDGPWFRARILPPAQQFQELDRIEGLARDWLRQNATASQRQRLQQLEWQALGVRMLLRQDIAQPLKLSSGQQSQFAELAKGVDQAQQALQTATTKGKPSNDLIEAAQRATQAERKAVTTLLQPDQQRRIGEITGPAFDTQQLQRIYPMAPELIPGSEWFNSEPLTLESLRGKVVLVHFYAFQCHNCQANFGIYRRWHEKLREQGVVVIGIQTPETQPERDLTAICKAATDNRLEFPILMDLKSENWKAWGNTMWPTVYVIDKKGYLRHWWQGELNWQGATGDQTIERIADDLLKEP
jgi:peroxiredoxin